LFATIGDFDVAGCGLTSFGCPAEGPGAGLDGLGWIVEVGDAWITLSGVMGVLIFAGAEVGVVGDFSAGSEAGLSICSQ